MSEYKTVKQSGIDYLIAKLNNNRYKLYVRVDQSGADRNAERDKDNNWSFSGGIREFVGIDGAWRLFIVTYKNTGIANSYAQCLSVFDGNEHMNKRDDEEWRFIHEQLQLEQDRVVQKLIQSAYPSIENVKTDNGIVYYVC